MTSLAKSHLWLLMQRVAYCNALIWPSGIIAFCRWWDPIFFHGWIATNHLCYNWNVYTMLGNSPVIEVHIQWNISMAQCKKDVTPLLMHVFLALSYWYQTIQNSTWKQVLKKFWCVNLLLIIQNICVRNMSRGVVFMRSCIYIYWLNQQRCQVNQVLGCFPQVCQET